MLYTKFNRLILNEWEFKQSRSWLEINLEEFYHLFVTTIFHENDVIIIQLLKCNISVPQRNFQLTQFLYEKNFHFHF